MDSSEQIESTSTSKQKLTLTHDEFVQGVESGQLEIDADHVVALKLGTSEFASGKYRLQLHAPNTLSFSSIPAALAAMYFYKFSVGLVMIFTITPFLHKYAQRASRKAMKNNLIRDPDFYRFAISHGNVNIKYKSYQVSANENINNDLEIKSKQKIDNLNKINKKLTIGLKAVIIYLIIYGLITGYWAITNLEYWVGAVAAEGKSIGGIIGVLMHGPLLGLLFFVSAIGLSIKRLWGRKIAVISLILAAFLDVKSFSWGYENGEPSSQILLVARVIITLWTFIWLYLLFKNSSNEVLR